MSKGDRHAGLGSPAQVVRCVALRERLADDLLEASTDAVGKSAPGQSTVGNHVPIGGRSYRLAPVHYPEIQPYDQGLLEVGDGNLVYWETSGNPSGKPALVVHAARDRARVRGRGVPSTRSATASFNSTSAAVGRVVPLPPTRPQT
jgi:hypothetical protein